MKRSNNRLRFIYTLFAFILMLTIVNVLFVNIGKIHLRSGTSLVDYIDSVANIEERIFASRGSIYDGSGIIVAQDIPTYDIICYLDEDRLASAGEKAYVDNPSYAANALAPILDMDAQEIYDILTSSSGLYQVELGAKGRNLSEEQKKEIEAIPDLHGISFRNSYQRYYPLGEEFSPQIVGFAQSDNTGKLIGQLGVESYFNDELSGTDGYHSYQQDKDGYILPGMYDEVKAAVNGYDIYLTIDMSIQEALDTALKSTIENKNASRAWGSVVEIKTGKILAWGQVPSFDPNHLSSDDVEVNFGAQLAYEPGSVMKSIIYSAAMDMGVYSGETEFNSAPFCYNSSGNRTYGDNTLGCINNVSDLNWGYIPLDYGLIYSSNVATATLLSEYVGVDQFENYLNKYHLYSRVNTDGIDEVAGYTNYGLSPVDNITATYGQGSSTTMLQLLQAYTAIFGNGEMIKPYYVDKIVDPNNDKIVYQGKRKVVSNPISADTAKRMQDLLRRVVSEPDGTCRHYAARTVEVMGKTGTSEIPLDGGYDENENIISCMLGFPYDDPQYMVYFAYVSPETVYYNYDIKPIPDLIDRIALLENIVINEEMNEAEQYIYRSKMPNLLGNKIISAKDSLNSYDVVIIGDGENVIDQYPQANVDVYSDQKIFLLTDGNNIYLPDFTGWTRKDLVNFWTLSKIPLVIDGYGVVYEQSVSENTIVDHNSEIILKLQDINMPEKEEEDKLDLEENNDSEVDYYDTEEE